MGPVTASIGNRAARVSWRALGVDVGGLLGTILGPTIGPNRARTNYLNVISMFFKRPIMRTSFPDGGSPGLRPDRRGGVIRGGVVMIIRNSVLGGLAPRDRNYVTVSAD